MISQYMGSSPTLGSALAEWSLLGLLCLCLSVSLSAPPWLMLSLKVNKLKKLNKQIETLHVITSVQALFPHKVLLSGSQD